jgi:hypothetical protein
VRQSIITYRVLLLEHQVDERAFEPPPGREVGELSARPLGFYTVSLAERCYSITLRYTKTKVIRSRRF